MTRHIPQISFLKSLFLLPPAVYLFLTSGSILLFIWHFCVLTELSMSQGHAIGLWADRETTVILLS